VRRDAGSATLPVLAAVALVAAVSVGAGSVGVLLSAREQAIAAAEAAALAAAVATYPPTGAGSPVAVAADLAKRNYATLVSCRCPVDGGLRARTVTVITAVTVDVPLFDRLTVRGGARAEFDPRSFLGR